MGNDQQGEKTSTPRTPSKAKNVLFSISGGGVGMNYIDHDDILEDFEEKNISDWGQNDILEWLDAIEFGELLEEFRDVIRDGEDLSSMEHSNPVFDKLHNEERRKLFFVYLHHIRKCTHPPVRPVVETGIRKNEDSEKRFSMNFHRVLKKLVRILDIKEMEIGRLQSYSHILSDEDKICTHFLDQRRMDTDDNEIRLKILLSETNYDPKAILSKKILTPHTSETVLVGKRETVTSSSEFRILSSIVIGVFFLIWDENEIVIPRRIEHGDDVLIEDNAPFTVNTSKTFVELRNKIAKVILKWNTRRSYYKKDEDDDDDENNDNDTSKNKKKKGTTKTPYEGNGYDFVMDVCKELEADVSQSSLLGQREDGPMSEILSQLKENGEMSLLRFEPSPEFERDFKLDGYEENAVGWVRLDTNGRYLILFGSHRELDDFLFFCYHANYAAMNVPKYEEEFRVLKCYDRIFWMRYIFLSSSSRLKKTVTGIPIISKDEEEEGEKEKSTRKEDDELEICRPSEADEERDRVFGEFKDFKSGCIFKDPRGKRGYGYLNEKGYE